MSRHRNRNLRILAALAAVLLIALAAAPVVARADSEPPAPAQVVQQAWQRAKELGVYDFTTDVSAVVYPPATLASIGRPGGRDQLHLEGSVDLPARTLALNLWQGAGSVLNPADSIEVRIEGDKAYGRTSGGSWEEINDFSGSFAPGGDLLVYLVGAKNVVELGSETVVLPVPEGATDLQNDEAATFAPASLGTFTRYRFELDGPAVAEEVRQQWQRQLLEQGDLPSGVEIQTPADLRDATGSGELWVDSQGLPARLAVEIAYPPDKNEAGSAGRATIQTDFSGFPALAARGSAGLLVDALRQAGSQAAAMDAPLTATKAALLLVLISFPLLLVFQSRSRRLYGALALAMVFSMVVSPLAESQRAAAFGRRQAAEQAAYEERQEDARARQEAQEALTTSSWDPHQDPLLAAEQRAAAQDVATQQAGLIAPYQVTEQLAPEQEPDPESDDDHDNLTYIEEIRLGTDPDNDDTDGDQLRDDLEVTGFWLGGRKWYSDPVDVDSNSDGRLDLYECWTATPEELPSKTPCDLDSDGDGQPDLFDRDDDGDGVDDKVDLSPANHMPASGAFSASSQFQLTLNDLEAGYLTFVELQIRPTNPEHLTYAFSVLDWPSGDTKGQVQRVLDTTLADGMTEEEIQKDPRSANGDLRLIPMLEVSVQYKAGHTRNLPVKPGWTGTLTATTPLESWVNMDVVEDYGLTLRYSDESGNLVIYAPLSLVNDQTGGASVAFTTKLPYQAMSSGDWGYAHQFRLVWALQMLVDHCKAVPDGEEAGSWCLLPENREEGIQIVHMYDDPWVLSGLDVREDHGVQMGIAFEDPATDADKEDDRNLWALANGLDQSWIAARDCDTLDADGNCVGDGIRDLTLPEIVNRFDNQSNSSIPTDDPRLWNIPKDALRIWREDFAYQDLMAAVPMTHTKEILNEHFLTSGQAVTPAPTLMFLREEQYRSANLDSRSEVASWNGSALQVNLVATYAPLEILAAMNWAPYRYRDGAWEPYPIEEYVRVLDPRMAECFPVDLNDPDGQAILDGQVIMARGFYLGMVQGTQEIVQSGDLKPAGPGQSHDQKLKEQSIKEAGNIVMTIVKLAAAQIVDRFYQYMVREFLGTGDYFTRVNNWYKYLGNFNKAAPEGKGGWIGWNAESDKWLSRFSRLSIATLIISTICAVALFTISCAIDTPVIPYIQSGLLTAANSIRALSSVYKFIQDFKAIKSGLGLKDAFKSLLSKASAPWSAAAKGAFIVTIIVEAVIALGVFFYSWLSSDIKAGSLAWDQMLVETIAKILIKTVLWALNFIPVIGKALYLIIAALDALAGFICKFISEEAKEKSKVDDWLCGGISGALTKAWLWFYYGQHNLVDLEDEERWQIGAPNFDLGDPTKGMAVGNTLYYQLTMTNSIHLVKYPVDWKAVAYWWQYNNENLQRATFDYVMSGEDELDLHSDLSLDDNADEWEKGSVRAGKDTYYIVRPVETEAPGAPLITAGINVTNSVYIHEGYAVPTQECIGIGLIPICWVREGDGTIPANLGNSFPWDVFPEDLTKFHELVAVDGGYSLAWSQDSDPPFGRQKDADGDALLSAIDGGPDQDDSDWDADNDGLSDYFELQVGLKPDQIGGYDGDGDGLNDREELLLGTDPFKADSDGDGLNDRQERDGWEFAYGFDTNGNPKMSWVTSDPNLLDTDADTLTDFQEYNYRYNPRAVSDPQVLGFTAGLSELLPSGIYTDSDGLVRSGDKLRYEAEVENNTFLSSAQGLYEANFPADRLSGSVAPRTFQLYPQETVTLTGELTVKSGITSGPANVTQNAGARITYALADSDYAQLVLHLEDPSTATTFADSSGNIPPHNGECTGTKCPTRQVAGYMGSAVQFDATKQQVITVPGADISAGDFGVAFWFKTPAINTRLFSSADLSVNLTLLSGQVCMDVQVLEWTTVPCTGLAYSDNEWHHLAVTFENSLGANLYIDGRWVLGGYYSGTRYNPNPASGVFLGQGYHWPYFYTGLLDDVVVYDRALTWQDVNALFGRPLFAAHLDEYAGATTFREDGGLTGTCLPTSICPSAGQAGMVRQSALFPGGQNISFPAPSISGEPFTLAAWVYPTLTGNNYFDSLPQGIAGRLMSGFPTFPTLVRVGTGIRAAFGDANGLVAMATVPDVLTPNVWNHVLLTYGQNQDGKGQFSLYVNGVPKGEQVLEGYPLVVLSPGYGLNIGNVAYESSISPSFPSWPFTGKIDEFLIYPFALSVAQVEELYHYQADALHLTFDEPPGTYQFQDALRRATGSCPADLASCPSAGVSGRTGQAAYFDGANDFLDAGTNPAISGTGPVSLAAWVRTSAAKNQVIVQQRSTAVYNGEYMLTLTSAGMVRWYVYGNSGAAEFSLISSKAVNDGKWHHVAAVRELDGSARIYIDGVQDAYLAPSTIATLVATNVYVGADTRDHAAYFEGYIDELHVVRRALAAGQVQELVQQAPRFLMHFEEAEGSYSFADDTEQGHEATCGWMHCPNAGIKGQVNLAVEFDGVNDGLITSYGVPASADKTIMAWVRPNSKSPVRRYVLGGTDPWSWSLFRDGATWHVGTGSLDSTLRDWNTGVEVQVGYWQHLAVVFSGKTARFYLNGHAMDELAIGDHSNNGTLSVGNERWSWNSPWDGRIDEVAIYERALTDAEIEALWLYQGQWVQETQTTPLIVDNDKPISRLVSDSPYRPNLPVNLLIKTTDADSAVVRDEWNVDSGAWQDAPPCEDALGAAWCPTFDPARFHGPGVYTIRTRATDAVGNISNVSSDPLYVDGAAPIISHNLTADALIQLEPDGLERDTWRLPVSGTVHDPDVASGVPGSGVQSLQVTLLDAYGRKVGPDAQEAVITAGTWDLTLRIASPLAAGAYAVHIEAKDQVGNLATVDVRIHLDQSAPEAELLGLPVGGAIMTLPLDEPVGSTRFVDSSGNGHDAVCGAVCPAAGLAGKYAQAVELDGASQSLVVIDDLTFASGDFTIAAWFQTSSNTWQTIAAATTTGDSAQDVVLLQITNGGKVRLAYTAPGDTAVTNLTSPPGFHDGRWHHAAAVRRQGELLLYVDGEILADKSDDRALTGSLHFELGAHGSSDLFSGRLDDVYVAALGLASHEVYNLAFVHDPPTSAALSGVVSEVPLMDGAVMELHLEETSGERFVDSSAYGNAATCSGTTCPGRVTTGLFGQSLQFDGADDRLSISNTSAFWARQDDWTLSAWIRPDRLSGDQQILAYGQSNSGGFGFGTHDAGLRFSAFGVGIYDSAGITLQTGVWQHVAMRLAGGDLTFFVDGVARQLITGTQTLEPNLIDTDSVYVGMTTAAGGSAPAQLFQGGIDELILFERALSRDELLALGAMKHAGVATLDLALTPMTPGSPYYNAPMPQGAQLYLPLDDTVSRSGVLQFLDISGLGHGASCTEPACPSLGHAGHAGGAAGFDGNDYLEIPLDVSETDYTLALRFKTVCADCGLFSVDAGTLGIQGHDRHVYLKSGFVCARVWYEETICTGGTNYADGRWHQVVHTLGGAEGGQQLYVDGLLQAKGNKSASDFTDQTGINIGFSNDAARDYFSGLLDEVIVFNRALPAAEVRALYLGTDTVLHLPLDESWTVNGTTLADSSGFANDGALHGATSNHAVAGTVGSGALQLDGDEYVTTGRSIDFARRDYTVAGWFRSTAAGQQMLLSATSPIGDAPGIQIYLDSGTVSFRHTAPAGGAGGTILSAPGTTFNDGAWHHVAGVKAGTAVTLYVDGYPYAVGTALESFGLALDITLGRLGKTTAGGYWNGALDDVRVYARALSAEELQDLVDNQSWGVLSPQTGVVRSNFDTSLNHLNTEGNYRVDLRSADAFGNRSDTTQGWPLWSGSLDSLAPRVTFQYQLTVVGNSKQAHYEFSAHDFGLSESGFISPCPASTILTREYFNAPWYRAWTYQAAANSDRLYRLSGQCDLPYTGVLANIKVCDAAGNCTMAKPELVVTPKPSVATAAPSAAPSPSGEGGVLILEPSPSTFLTTTLPLQIQGGAFSPDYLKSLTIRDGVQVIDNLHWAHLAVTDTTWTTTWTPDGEGPHQIEATLRDWAGGSYTDTVTVILDTQPPEVAITTAVLTSTHLAGGQVTVAGTATDANGIVTVDLQARGVWRPARVEDGTWTATWIPDLGEPPDGQTFSGVVRAVDRAGWTTLASGDVYVDAASPAPVDLALSYQTAGETIAITRTGTTIREPAGALQLTWTASSDGSGLAGYRAGWTAVGADGSANTTWTTVSPDEPLLATTAAGEGQKLVASLETRDLYGNTTRQGFGPLYVDSPLTPDYIRLENPGAAYHGWMDSGCTLLGTDRRLSRILPTLAQRYGEQALYATWDDQALRLAWNGANWSAEGDLFVYLDTLPGGSDVVFDPYTPANVMSAAGSSGATLVSLPGSTATATEGEAMLADYGIWVEDAQTAWLLTWDGSTWITTTLLSRAEYRYQPSEQGGLTDLYLPFDLLGISDPATTPLGLLAFASEEEALRIWAVLPQVNPVTSLQATGAFGHLLEALSAPMSQYYRWPSLDSGICPNGRQSLEPDQTPYPDSDVQARLSADPAGTVYHYLGDHLYAWSDALLGDKPLDFSQVLEFLDHDQPYMHDGQLVNYTLRLQNKGQDATHEVVARIWSAAALTLPGGAPVGGDEHLYFQEIPIGDLAPGQELSLTFQGRIDLAWARPRYEQCLATYPDRPRLCELALRFALLKVEIVDQTYTTPLERIWADHRVDFEAPRFAGIDQSSLIISAGSASLRGYAYDDSGVPLITLEVRRPDGLTISLHCPNPNPDSGIWSCDWDPTEVNDGVPPEDGQIFQVRLLATDGAGLTSEPGPWYPFVVDTEPPAVTAQLPTVVATGLPVSARTVRLAGQLADNHAAAGVEVCLEDNCRSASTALEGQPTLLQYDDLPATTVPLATCEATAIQRTFLVTDTFMVRAVGLGLRAEHSDRDQIRAELVSPAGTRVRILSGEGVSGSDYQNYTLLLADAAGGALSQLGRDHDITVPDFVDVARPDEPLIAFMGEEAAGTWTLALCDTDADGDEGNYLAGRLYLLPRDTAALNGSWSQGLSLPELDGVEQTLTAYGLDRAGNRTSSPWGQTFVVDNVAPSISVSLTIDAVQLTPDLAALEVLAGSAADGGQVRRLYAMIRTPEGQLHNQPVTRDGDDWSFALQTMIVGVHTIYIVAEDVAGNRTAVGPFTVMVTGIVEQPEWKLYLPLVLNAAGGSEAALAPVSSVGVLANAGRSPETGPALSALEAGAMEGLVEHDAILEPHIDQSYGQNKRLKERSGKEQ